MISTVTQHTGAVVVTPPAVGTCAPRPAEQVVSMAPFAALLKGTGLSIAGVRTPVRLRGRITDAGTTGFSTTGVAVPAATDQHKSSTPGDQPPEDPLS